MGEPFLSAVVDTILPGERAASGAASPLPSGTQAGLVLRPDDRRHAGVLRAIAMHGGGEEAFAGASPEERAAVLEAVEKESFEPFRALVLSLLRDYYETPTVLAAMGWRGGGAQPQGHEVPEADAATLRRLDKVRARGPIWRKAEARDRSQDHE
ncbi:MAG: hypothetical protein ACHQAY_06490 [Hyphomicrobiales bacterium]